MTDNDELNAFISKHYRAHVMMDGDVGVVTAGMQSLLSADYDAYNSALARLSDLDGVLLARGEGHDFVGGVERLGLRRGLGMEPPGIPFDAPQPSQPPQPD